MARLFPGRYLTEEKRIRREMDSIKQSRDNAHQAYQFWDMRLNIKQWELQNFLSYKKENKCKTSKIKS
jgi:hypothetical protein